jgi:hypothetical protein
VNDNLTIKNQKFQGNAREPRTATLADQPGFLIVVGPVSLSGFLPKASDIAMVPVYADRLSYT